MGLFRSDFHCFEVNGDTLLALASGEIFVLDGLAKVVLDEVLRSDGLDEKAELTGFGADCGIDCNADSLAVGSVDCGAANLKVCATDFAMGGDARCDKSCKSDYDGDCGSGGNSDCDGSGGANLKVCATDFAMGGDTRFDNSCKSDHDGDCGSGGNSDCDGSGGDTERCAECGGANLKVCATGGATGGATDGDTGGASTAGDAVNTVYTSEEIAEARGELERILCRKIKDHSGDTPPRQLRAICLNVTHRCNLACEYCFAGKVVDKCAPSMDSAIVRQSIDFLIRESGDVPRLQVDFFGGEPLLVFPLVKEGIIYGEQRAAETGKRIGFTLTTNAVLLNDEVIDFVKEHNVSLILSLDGDRDANDAHRKTHNGDGSFDVVFKNISKVKEKLNKNQYYVRGTFTSKTPEIHSALEFYDKQGFYNVSLEPVTSEDGTGYALREQDMPTLLDSYNKAAQWMLDRDMQFFHFNLEMDNPLCLTRRITGCGAGVEYMAVDPGGNLYPCHQFIEMQGYSIGDVFNGISNDKLIETFRQSTIYQKEGCSDCWARFYCGGGCHFRHFSENGDINRPSSLSCRLFTKRLETALWYNVKKREKAGTE
ncbi:MAG: SPASM domain-containing protein [Firmicutes bacterium]|nr:SPASM domain-containing protein [Bacillota bacterium]